MRNEYVADDGRVVVRLELYRDDLLLIKGALVELAMSYFPDGSNGQNEALRLAEIIGNTLEDA